MKITKKILKILECCDSGIFKFINTSELHNINDDIKGIIIKDDINMFRDFVFFLNKINKHIVDFIKSEFSGGYWKKYTYNDNGNLIKSEDSNGYWKKYTYVDKGNQIKCENSNGYWKKFIYDMDKITFVKE